MGLDRRIAYGMTYYHSPLVGTSTNVPHSIGVGNLDTSFVYQPQCAQHRASINYVYDDVGKYHVTRCVICQEEIYFINPPDTTDLAVQNLLGEIMILSEGLEEDSEVGKSSALSNYNVLTALITEKEQEVRRLRSLLKIGEKMLRKLVEDEI